MPTIINFNGTNYNNLDDMPADVRRQYEQAMGAFADNNQDGMPDMLEGLVKPGTAMPLVQGQATIMYDGQMYHGLDQLPPEARAKYEKFQAQFDANGNGLPDALEGFLGAMLPVTAAPANPADAANAPAFAASAPIAPSVPVGRAASPYASSSVVSPEGADIRLKLAILAIVGLGAMVCVLAVIVAWAVLR